MGNLYLTYCQNCGSESHCGVARYTEALNPGYPAIKACDSCRCINCRGVKCFKCQEMTTEYKAIDYRDHKDELKGTIHLCKTCLNKEDKDDE
jgi:hypothetical protein